MNMIQKDSVPTLIVLAFAGLLISVGEVAAQNYARNVPWSTPYYTYMRHSNIVYGQGEVNGGGSFKNLTLDLYIPDIPAPENATNQLPLMLMIHGPLCGVVPPER